MKAKLVKEGDIREKNLWLLILKKDLLQNKYNLKKEGLYSGSIKEQIDNLIYTLIEDYDT